MTLNALPPSTAPPSAPEQQQTTNTPSYILSCPYCQWSTLDIDLTFSKPTNLTEQIKSRQQHSHNSNPEGQSQFSTGPPSQANPAAQDPRFSRLKSHLLSQLSLTNSSSSTNPLLTPSGTLNYDSPSSLARIMALYTSSLTPYGKKSSSKTSVMREALDASEGLMVFSPEQDIAAVEKLKSVGWSGTVSGEQRREQAISCPEGTQPRFQDELRPIPMLMRTKRAKRCRACRHILVKPEAKISSTRYRIRLIASNTLPSITLKRLASPSSVSRGATSDLLSALPANGTPQQFLLTLRNPLFEKTHVTLSTPPLLPLPKIPPSSTHSSTRTTNFINPKLTHRITLLCPSFDIGANTDAWDEALSKDTDLASHSTAKEKRASLSISAIGGGGGGGADGAAGKPKEKVAEAGKIWEKGRNWTTVVLEVVSSRSTTGSNVSPMMDAAAPNQASDGERVGDTSRSSEGREDRDGDGDGDEESDDDYENDNEEEDENNDDDSILEIPIFVRMEWEAETSTSAGSTAVGAANIASISGDGRSSTATATGGGGGNSLPTASTSTSAPLSSSSSALQVGSKVTTTGREKRELGYWMVLGVGKMGLS